MGRSCSFVTIEPSQLSTPASQGITATIVPKSPRAVGSLLGTIVSKAHRWESDGDHFATCVIRGLEGSHSRIPGNNKWSRLLSRLSPLHSMHPQSQYLTSSVQEFLSQFLAQRGHSRLERHHHNQHPLLDRHPARPCSMKRHYE